MYVRIGHVGEKLPSQEVGFVANGATMHSLGAGFESTDGQQ